MSIITYGTSRPSLSRPPPHLLAQQGGNPGCPRRRARSAEGLPRLNRPVTRSSASSWRNASPVTWWKKQGGCRQSRSQKRASAYYRAISIQETLDKRVGTRSARSGIAFAIVQNSAISPARIWRSRLRRPQCRGRAPREHEQSRLSAPMCCAAACAPTQGEFDNRTRSS